jgi:hypothetical protein
MSDAKTSALDTAQAFELAAVVELEARWENLRAAQGVPTLQTLHGKQKAYEAFRVKLATYNKRYSPAYISELLLNTSERLGLWCRTLRNLFAQLEGNTQVRCPAQCLEKAYRWAELIARKETKPPVIRNVPASTQEAVLALDGLCQWCATLASVAPAA